MILLFIVSFATTLGMSSLMTIWPLYILSLGATVLQAGYVISFTGIIGTILTGFSGAISDRLGRKRIILASIILAVISPLLYLRTESWQELFLWGSLYSSVFSLFMPTRNAWIADLVEPEERSAAYSFLFLALPTAGVAGPILGGIIVDNLGWNTLFMLIAAVHGLSILPIVLISDSQKPTVKVEESSAGYLSENGQTEVLFLMILLWFILGLGFGTVNTVIPLYLTEKLKSTKTQIGIFTSIGFGVTGAVSQVLSAKLADRFGNRRFLFYCCSAIPLTFLLWPSRTTYLELLALRMVGMAAWTASWSPAVATVMEASPTRKKGLFSGLFEASVRFGMTVGPTLAGILWEDWGFQAPFYIASLIFASSVPVTMLVERFQLPLSDGRRTVLQGEKEETFQYSQDGTVLIKKSQLLELIDNNGRLIDRCKELLQTEKDLKNRLTLLEEKINNRRPSGGEH